VNEALDALTALWAAAQAHMAPGVAEDLAQTDWLQLCCIAVVSYLGVRAMTGSGRADFHNTPPRERARVRRTNR
jgi:hypothetical protein